MYGTYSIYHILNMLYNIQCVYPDSDIEYVYPNKDTFRFCQYYTYHYIYSTV